jgi:hypothetical protein
MPQLDRDEILFADDTLIFAEPGHSLDVFVWAIEAVSAAYGMNLNRDKCERISLNGSNVYSDGKAVPESTSTVYLGSSMNTKADPGEEVKRRIAGARYVWQKLKDFSRFGHISGREKILIYNALIGSKLLYGLHVLPVKDEYMQKLDAFHLQGLRQILHLKTTYIERANTNEFVIQRASAELSKKVNGAGDALINTTDTEWTQVKPVSVILRERSKRELGEIIRLKDGDIRRRVTLLEGSAEPNLPILKRAGRPKTHWTLLTMERVWEDLMLANRSQLTTGQAFDSTKNSHLDIIEEAARANEF